MVFSRVVFCVNLPLVKRQLFAVSELSLVATETSSSVAVGVTSPVESSLEPEVVWGFSVVLL